MEYKLLPQFRGRFGVEPVFAPMRYELMAMPVTDIGEAPTRSMHRFDIEVEDSHNYLVDGVVVHNSPETTPGGRALKFYSSVRLDIRRVEAIKDGADVIGSRTRVKVVKNKCSSPLQGGRVRHHVRQGDQPGGLPDRRRPWSSASSRSRGPGSPTRASSSARAGRTPSSSCAETPELMIEINEKIRSQLAAVVLPAGAAVGVAANDGDDLNGSTVDSDNVPISIKD
jgi:recombination protein RecA